MVLSLFHFFACFYPYVFLEVTCCHSLEGMLLSAVEFLFEEGLLLVSAGLFDEDYIPFNEDNFF